MWSGACLFGLLGASLLHATTAYWMEDIPHQGQSSFNPDPSYQVFRNVKSYGARGDGVNDDTAAINAAISSGNRCGFGGTCSGSAITPATVYFPAGTYLISESILDTYYTQLIGDPTSMPVLKAAPYFTTNGTLGLIEADQYNGPILSYGSTNVFYRQVRNLVIDTTSVPGPVYGIHWPSSQATSIQNCIFRLSQHPGAQHTGIFMESGSGGFLGDLVFYGGQYGAQFGNQQYTARNLTFYNSQTAILQLWDWFWVYKSIKVVNCGVGIDTTSSSIGSVTLLDSVFLNTSIGIVTGRNIDPPATLPSQGTMVIENVVFSNVDTIFQGLNKKLVSGYGNSWITGKVLGNVYTPSGPTNVFDGPNDWFPSPTALKDGQKYYERCKPQYQNTPASLFFSARTFGAQGDGVTDDTMALTILFAYAAQRFGAGGVAFVDAGYYKVTDTIYIPPDIRIVGEALSSVIMGAGAKFSDMNNPRPVVQVGSPGKTGIIEWSDMIVSTQGATSGAVLIQYNLAAPYSSCETCGISGMWDVHTRIGGFAGSQLQVGNCPSTPDWANVISSGCIAAYMSMHITPSASGLYMENNWLWVADHDIEDPGNAQITVYAGRGLLIESTSGKVWVVASGVEHHTLYQYQLVNTQNVWMGQIQTETPYYQPNPPAPYPFNNVNSYLHDPDFSSCDQHRSHSPRTNITAACEMAWGLRIVDSSNVVIYGAGLYSFFNNYNTTCSNGPLGSTMKCQARVASIDGGNSENVVVYDLTTIGSINMMTNDGKDVAMYKDNWGVFGETLALFKA